MAPWNGELLCILNFKGLYIIYISYYYEVMVYLLHWVERLKWLEVLILPSLIIGSRLLLICSRSMVLFTDILLLLVSFLWSTISLPFLYQIKVRIWSGSRVFRPFVFIPKDSEVRIHLLTPTTGKVMWLICTTSHLN